MINLYVYIYIIYTCIYLLQRTGMCIPGIISYKSITISVYIYIYIHISKKNQQQITMYRSLNPKRKTLRAMSGALRYMAKASSAAGLQEAAMAMIRESQGQASALTHRIAKAGNYGRHRQKLPTRYSTGLVLARCSLDCTTYGVLILSA